MKIRSIAIAARPPIARFEVDELADVVVIAGPNGVGKTNILNALLDAFRNPGNAAQLTVEATSDWERDSWGGRSILATNVPEEAAALRKTLQRSQKRGQLRSGVLNFDSTRVFENIQPYNFNWNFSDPFLEDIGWDVSLASTKHRFQDVVHALYRKIRSQKEDIAAEALRLQHEGIKQMELAYPDPIEKFKIAFAQLLPGKTLVELDEKNQELKYKWGAKVLPFTSLSSGEREVVTVVFDFLLRAPKDSVVVFDEPELHLHPELSYRLLRTLRDSGTRNQFIYCTHSADIIGASLDQSVIFVREAQGETVNQAIQVGVEHPATKVLRLLGQSIGVISLGKRIVLIEGDDSSLDKQTYGAILGTSGNSLVLVPTGGAETIRAFQSGVTTVLDKSIWGVEFFMLCDGDSAVGQAALRDPRFRVLDRYHLENYFLDAKLLARVFDVVGEAPDSWLRDSKQIEDTLREVARTRIAHAAALRVSHRFRQQVGNIDLLVPGCHSMNIDELASATLARASSEIARIQGVVDQTIVDAAIRQEIESLSAAVMSSTADWKRLIPGKPILSQFAARAKLDVGRLKTLYIREAGTEAVGDAADPFSEIRTVFGHFASYTS